MADAGKLAQALTKRVAECTAQANEAMTQHHCLERAAREALEKANIHKGAAQAFQVALQDLQRQEAAEQAYSAEAAASAAKAGKAAEGDKPTVVK